jgi:hypothetical protein
MTTFYIDPENGNDANAGTSFAAAWKTMKDGATAVRIAAGDTIRMKSSPLPTLLGSCTFTNNNEYITIPSGLAKLLTDCEATTNWTASTNNTITAATSNWINGTKSIANSLTSSFTTGKFAVYDFGSNQDLSAFRQLNLFIKVATTSIIANNLIIKFCSDAAGDTEIDAIHVFTVPFALSSANASFHRTVFSHPSGNFSNSVRSISFHIGSTAQSATTVVYLDNIFVTKDNASADGFNLHSLLSKTNDITTLFGTNLQTMLENCPIPIRALDSDTSIRIDGNKNGNPTTAIVSKYYGTTETVNAYIYRPFLETGNITSANFAVTDSGSSYTSKIVYSGGWNSTDMSSQDNISLFAGITGNSSITLISASTYNTIERIGFSNVTTCFALGWNTNLSGTLLKDSILINSVELIKIQSDWYGSTTSGVTFKNVIAGYQLNGFSNLAATSGSKFTFENCAAITNSNPSAASLFGVSMSYAKYKNCAAIGSYRGYGFSQYGAIQDEMYNFSSCLGSNNYSGDIYISGVNALGYNCSLNSTNEIVCAGHYDSMASQRHDGTVDNDLIFYGGYKLTKQSTVTQSGSGYAQKLDVTNSIFNSVFPALIPIASVLCTSGVSKTVTIYLRRSNTGLTLGLMAMGSVTSDGEDVLAPMTANADTWEQVTLTFTPNLTGLLPIYVYAYGGTTYSGYIDTIGV